MAQPKLLVSRVAKVGCRILAPIRASWQGNHVAPDRGDRVIARHPGNRARRRDDAVAQKLAEIASTRCSWRSGPRRRGDRHAIARADPSEEHQLLQPALAA